MYAIDTQPIMRRVDDMLLPQVLKPYKHHCRYLQRASLEYRPDAETSSDNVFVGRGEFTIPESSYIESTGHFNAAEFIMCFNQLGYVMLVEAIRSRLGDWQLFPKLRFEALRAWQLAQVVILSVDSLKFRKMIDAKSFSGEIQWVGSRQAGGLVLMSTRCSFYDSSGARAHGNVRVAVLDAY